MGTDARHQTPTNDAPGLLRYQYPALVLRLMQKLDVAGNRQRGRVIPDFGRDGEFYVLEIYQVNHIKRDRYIK